MNISSLTVVKASLCLSYTFKVIVCASQYFDYGLSYTKTWIFKMFLLCFLGLQDSPLVNTAL